METQYQVEVISRYDNIKEKFYAICVECILKHPAVVAISDTARHSIFQYAITKGGVV